MTNKAFFSILFTLLLVVLLLPLSGQAKGIEKTSITDGAVSLRGPDSKFTYDYYLDDPAAKTDNEFHLDVSYSSLLLKPSSVTIKIDGEKKQTISIVGDSKNSKLTIPLTGSALKKGSHTITVEYYGIIKEGVCVENNTSGNWLKINPSSYIQLNGELTASNISLSDYPTKFSSFGTKSKIVIPENASVKTVNTALKITSYLKKQSTKAKNITLIYENEIDKESANLILVGENTAFKSSKAKEILEKAKPAKVDNALNLSTVQLPVAGQKRNILVVSATKDEYIDKDSELLTDTVFINQLSGKSISVSNMPEQTLNNSGTISFEEMNIDNIELGSDATKSHHYYYLPQNFDKKQNLKLTLLMKKSTILKANTSELTVDINDIPHSVSLKNIDGKDGFSKATITIDKSTLKNQNLLDMQFTLNGSNTNSQCKTTDLDKWLYISEDSSVSYTVTEDQQQSDLSLMSFPSTFTNSTTATAVVVDKIDKQTLAELVTLYDVSAKGAISPNYELFDSNTVSNQNLDNRNSIIIGTIDKLTKKLQKNSALEFENGEVNLTSHGFIDETVARYATIQSSPWNNKYLTLEITNHHKNSKALSEKLLNSIGNMKMDATIIVESSEGETFTNSESLLAEKANQENKKETKSYFSVVSVILYIGLLGCVGITILYIVRRNKKTK